MATLSSRISDLAAAVRDKFNAINPKLIPSGGTTGQVLAKKSDTTNDVEWKTVSSSSNDDSFINAIIFGG